MTEEEAKKEKNKKQRIAYNTFHFFSWCFFSISRKLFLNF